MLQTMMEHSFPAKRILSDAQIIVNFKNRKYDYDYANKLIAGKKSEQLEMYFVGLITGI